MNLMLLRVMSLAWNKLDKRYLAFAIAFQLFSLLLRLKSSSLARQYERERAKNAASDNTATLLLMLFAVLLEAVVQPFDHYIVGKFILPMRQALMETFFHRSVGMGKDRVNLRVFEKTKDELARTYSDADQAIIDLTHGFCTIVRQIAIILTGLWTTATVDPLVTVLVVVVWGSWLYLYGYKTVLKNGKHWGKVHDAASMHKKLVSNDVMDCYNNGTNGECHIGAQDQSLVNLNGCARAAEWNDTMFSLSVTLVTWLTRACTILYIHQHPYSPVTIFLGISLDKIRQAIVDTLFTTSSLVQTWAKVEKLARDTEKVYTLDDAEQKLSKLVDDTVHTVVKTIQSAVKKGSVTVLSSVSGAGKTTGMIAAAMEDRHIHFFSQFPNLLIKGMTVCQCLGLSPNSYNDKDKEHGVQALEMAGLADQTRYNLDMKMENPSGGEHKRLAFARWLFQKFRTGDSEKKLILDELSNHLDNDTFSGIVQRLMEKGYVVVMTSHVVGEPPRHAEEWNVVSI